jgi:hypothetical protein
MREIARIVFGSMSGFWYDSVEHLSQGWPYVFIVSKIVISKGVELVLDYDLDSYWLAMTKITRDRDLLAALQNRLSASTQLVYSQKVQLASSAELNSRLQLHLSESALLLTTVQNQLSESALRNPTLQNQLISATHLVNTLQNQSVLVDSLQPELNHEQLDELESTRYRSR